MKKLIFFIGVLIFADKLTYENNSSLNKENNTTHQTEINFSKEIKFTKPENNFSNENNSSITFLIPENNISNVESNISEKNSTITIKNEINSSMENNLSNETNFSEKNDSNFDFNISDMNISFVNSEINTSTPPQENKIEISTQELNSSFIPLNPNINIGVVFEKNTLKRYKKSILSSINTYLLYKNVNFHIKVFDDLNTACSYYENIIYFTTDTNLSNLKNYPNNFFFPIIYDNNTSADNLFFGGLDFKNQIDKLISFMKEKKAVIINSNTKLAKKLTKIETKELNSSILMNTDRIYYRELNESYIFFNTPSNITAKILSNINYQNLQPNLQFSSQINYDPLLIKITQPQDVEKLLIANSILNFPIALDSYNNLLNTNIRFNWVNYATSLLLNKLYNISTNGEEFFLNDFKTNIFNNQVDYKTKIYQIIDNSFRVVY